MATKGPYLRLNKELNQVLDEWSIGSPLLSPFGPEGSHGIIIRNEESLIQEVSSSLSHGSVGRVDQFIHVLTVLVCEDVTVVLEDGDDKTHRLHRHVILLIQSHGHYAVFELAGEELKFALQLLTCIEWLQRLQTLESHVPNLVMQRPTNVLQVRVIQEILVKFLHPQPNLCHADRADLRQCVPAKERHMVKGTVTSQ